MKIQKYAGLKYNKNNVFNGCQNTRKIDILKMLLYKNYYILILIYVD